MEKKYTPSTGHAVLIWIIISISFPLFSFGQQCAFNNNFNLPLNDDCTDTLMLSNVITNFGACDVTQYVVVVRDTIFTNLNDSLVTMPSHNTLLTTTGLWDYDSYNWAVIDQPGTFEYYVYSFDNTDSSWTLRGDGIFTAEDKIGATFCCATEPLDQYGSFRSVYFNELDTMKLGAGGFYPRQTSAWVSTQVGGVSYTWPDGNIRYFDSIKFTPEVDGIYTFHVGPLDTNGITEPKFDPAIAVYRGNFDRTQPGKNLINFSAATFSVNPAAGLGYDIGSISSYFGTSTTSDSLSPWEQYKFPITRLSLPLNAGDTITVVVTHEEPTLALGTTDSLEYFKLFAVLDSHDPTSAAPAAILDTNGTNLPVLRAIQYHDFYCGDLPAVQLNQQVILSDSEYIVGGKLSSSNCSVWNAMGENLVGLPANDNIQQDIQDYATLFGQSISSTDDIFYRYGFKPYVIENCGAWEVSIQDSTANEGGDLGLTGDQFGMTADEWVSNTITRTYRANDLTANDTASCSIRMIFQNPLIEDVVLPHFTYSMECDEFETLTGVQLTTGGLPSPEVSGYPFLLTLQGTVALTPTNEYCNLGASYEDSSILYLCGGTRNFSFRRTWTIYDNARPGTSIIYHQLIRVTDFSAPDIVSNAYELEYDTMGCASTLTIYDPEITDNCLSEDGVNLKLFITDTIGRDVYPFTNVGPDYNFTDPQLTIDLPNNDYLIRYIATDSCSNQSVLIDTVSINLAFCKDTILVLDGVTGEAALNPLDLFLGDLESCNISSLSLDTFQFNAPDTVDVTLTINYVSGSSSTCVSEVVIEDNSSASFLLDPTFTPSLTNFGTLELSVMDLIASVSDNVTNANNLIYSFAPDTEEMIKSLTCADIGSMDLTVYVTDQAGNMAQQSITVNVEDTGGACSCRGSYLSIQSSNLPAGLYSSSDRIVASNIIEAGNNIQYIASTSITLRPGFEVKAGADFLAAIGTCQVPPASPNLLSELEAEEEKEAEEVISEKKTMHHFAQEKPGLIENTTVKGYPNPTTGVFNLELGYYGTGQMADLRVVNLFGQTVWRTQWPLLQGLDKRRFDLSHLPAGSYAYVLLVDEEPLQSSQLIIMRR